MILHHFDKPEDAIKDIRLQLAIAQGYVPSTCRLGGNVVMGEVQDGRDPCAGCRGDRSICFGRPNKE